MKIENLKTSIIINEKNEDNRFSGILTIHSPIEINLEKIQAFILFEGRGRMSSFKKNLQSFNIPCERKISENQTYEIPFSFTLSDIPTPSYRGKNVSLTYKLEFKIMIADIDKFDRSIFSTVKSFITSDNSVKVSQYIVPNLNNTEYNIVNKQHEFHLTPSIATWVKSSVLSAIIYFALLATLGFSIDFFHLLLIAVGAFIFSQLINSYKKSVIGNISLRAYKNDTNSFNCEITKSSGFKLSNKKIYYQIVEKVVDDRGTSSSTYKEIIYSSPFKRLSKLKKQEINFEFPIRKELASLEYDDVTIFWEVIIEGEFSGFTEKFSCEIETYN